MFHWKAWLLWGLGKCIHSGIHTQNDQISLLCHRNSPLQTGHHQTWADEACGGNIHKGIISTATAQSCLCCYSLFPGLFIHSPWHMLWVFTKIRPLTFFRIDCQVITIAIIKALTIKASSWFRIKSKPGNSFKTHGLAGNGPCEYIRIIPGHKSMCFSPENIEHHPKANTWMYSWWTEHTRLVITLLKMDIIDCDTPGSGGPCDCTREKSAICL